MQQDDSAARVVAARVQVVGECLLASEREMLCRRRAAEREPRTYAPSTSTDRSDQQSQLDLVDGANEHAVLLR